MKMRLALAVALALLSTSVSTKDDGKKADVGTVIGIDLGTTYSW